MLAVPEVSLIFKIASIAIIISIFYSFLRQAGRDEYAYMILLAGLAVVFMLAIPAIMDLFQAVERVFNLY
ncbi:MAG: stage III sporulation protein AC [Clostridia bacterium]|jgi:stage III sporulation protein AC|nr:stage III sporulation protein AC [Clostridia bacterium]